ncbi:hypothetical protein F5Y15DRAFT_255200 [Xylariaceae sp. FL0016]|nr:hypothetical protein F5Y15DRAFT_255200 [Xylariaceae sp. FL0016]
MAEPNGLPPSVHGFLQALQAFSSSESVTSLCGLEKENSELRAEVASKATAIVESGKEISRLDAALQAEAEKTAEALEQAQELQKSEQELKENLDTTTAEIKKKEEERVQAEEDLLDMVAKLKISDDDLSQAKAHLEERDGILAEKAEEVIQLNKVLAERQDELQKKTDSLSSIERLSVEMTELSDLPLSSIKKSLDRVFVEARAIAKDYLGTDLSQDTLEDTKLWDDLRKKISRTNIPLPASNSQPAKQMRSIAFVSMLGFELITYIFVPVYFPFDNMESFWDMLADLAADDEQKETYLRSVLLSHYPVDDDDWRIDDVVKHSWALVNPLVPEDQKKAFCNAITKLCQSARQDWSVFQKLKVRIVPDEHFDRPLSGQWEKVPLPTNSQPAKPNGVTPNGITPKQSREKIIPDSNFRHPICMVWPSFIAIQEAKTDVIRPGLLLLKAQAQAQTAQDELNTQLRSGPNRLARERTRRRSSMGQRPFLEKNEG